MTTDLRHRVADPDPGPSTVKQTKQNLQDQDALKKHMAQQSTTTSRFFIFCVCLVVRLLNAWLTRTYDNPDEYWQSQEIAHTMVFGYGYVSWEWHERIRSYAHPAVFALLYKVIAVLGLDDTRLLLVAPKMFQAVLAAVADYCTYSLGKRLMGGTIAPYLLFTLLSSWYLFFMAGRTLSNTMETVLTLAALNDWPLSLDRSNWKKDYRKALVWASLACVMRPTNALLWLFLGGHLLWRAQGERWTVALSAFLITQVGTVLAANIAIDTRIYTGVWDLSKVVLTPFNFIKVNVLQSISVIYGVHPWHWYFSQGVPVILTTFLPFSVYGYQKSKVNAPNRLVGHLVLYVLGVYSLLSHKEFRFIFPIVPLLLIFAAKGLQSVPSRWKRVACLALVGTQLPMAIYLSLWHQRGVMDAMLWVREHKPASIGILMPCHSTPWQSVVHAPKVDMWFLTCEPPLYDDALDEADQFYADPAGFLREMKRPWPAALLMFDSLLPSVQPLLDARGYYVCARFFNTHFHDDRRRRGDVLAFCRG